jgi:hypothetical protein
MSFDNIVANDYGQVAKLTFIDTDTDAAANISSYSTTIQMIFTGPSGTSTTKTATFDSDGSDGIIKYTIEQSLIDAAGDWQVRGKVASASAVLTTAEHNFEVLP